VGKAKRFNPYDESVAEKRKLVQSYGEARQKLSIGSSFRSSPLEPPIATSTASTGGTGDGKFLTVSLAADQTANIAVNNHIEWDTKDEDGKIVLQTGAGQSDGLFELESGKKYYLQVSLRPEFSGTTGQLEVAWFDETNSAEIGSRAKYEAMDHSGNDANQPTASALVTPATNILVKVEILSVTALDALANEYCHANLFEIALGGAGSGGGGGGSSGVTFPITPSINDHGNVGTVTEDIDIGASTGHVHKLTLTGNPTLTFSNPPSSGTQMEFEIEFVQDSTGGRTVTHPSSVAETVTINTNASTTTIVTYRTNDGGTTYHAIPALRGTISLSGSFANQELSNLGTVSINTSLISDTDNQDDLGSSSKQWKDLYIDGTANIDALSMGGDITMGAKDILTCKNLRFDNSGGLISGVAMINADSTGDLNFNVNTGDKYQYHFATVAKFAMDVTTAEFSSATSDTNNIHLHLSDTTPSNNDIPGKLEWKGFDDVGGGPFIYASIWGVMEDVSAATIDASIKFSCVSNSSEISLMTMNFANNITRCFQDLVPSGASKDLGTATLEWDNLFINTINPASGGDITFAGTLAIGDNDVSNVKVLTIGNQSSGGDPTITSTSSSQRLNFNTHLLYHESDPGVNAPIFRMYGNRTNGSDGDIIELSFDFNDSGNAETTFAQILATSLDVTNTSEDGSMGLFVRSNDSFLFGLNIVGSSSGLKLGFFNTTAVVQPSHIVDADGTLADITTKFNTLMADMAALGLQAAS